MESKFVRNLVIGMAVLGASAMGVNAQETVIFEGYGPNSGYRPPPKPPESNEYANCVFFDKIHFTYPVRANRKGFHNKDFDVIVATKYTAFTDLSKAVADKLDAICKGTGPYGRGEIYCPFGSVDEAKITIKGVDLAVSCR